MSQEVKKHLRLLASHVAEDDDDNVVREASKVLELSPTDKDAYQCKLTALLRTNPKEALSFITSSPALLSEFHFEHAYTLYVNGQLEQGLKVLAQVAKEELHDREQHLHAQILYKLGRFRECYLSYTSYFNDPKMDDEIRTNVCAALVSEGNTEEAACIFGEQRDGATFELLFNASLAFAAEGDTVKANHLLASAEETCRQSMEKEGFEQQQISSEVARILVQKAFISHAQGDAAVYQEVLRSGSSDQNAMFIAANNLVCTRRPEEKVFDSIKRLSRALTPETITKLSPQQRRVLGMNRCLLYMFGKQEDNCLSSVEKLQQLYPDSEIPALTKAWMFLRDKQASKCDRTLSNYIKAHPSQSQMCRLASAHIQLQQGNIESAIEVVQGLDALFFTPGMVATQVALFRRLNLPVKAAKTLDSAITYWTNYMGDDTALASRMKQLLMSEGASLKMSLGLHQEAYELFSVILKEDPSNMKVLANTVIAASFVDPDTAATLATRLGKLPHSSVSDVNIDALEQSSGPKSLTSTLQRSDSSHSLDEKKQLSNEELAAVAERKKARRKRKRKKLYPKGFDPEKPGPPPDAERWLPKWRRKSAKKRKGRNQPAFRGGAQGGREDDGLDMRQRKEEMKNTPSPPPAKQKQKQQRRKKKRR